MSERTDEPGQYIERILQLNPFDRTEREVQRVPVRPGATVADYVEDLNGPDTAIALHGEVLSPERQISIIPKARAQIIVTALPHGGSSIWKTLATVAVTVAAVAAAALIPAGAVFLGMHVAALASGAIAIGGGLLVNALFQQGPKAQAESQFSWGGPQMKAREGIAIPSGGGRIAISGNVIDSYLWDSTAFFNSQYVDQQYMNILLCFGHGPVRSIGNIKVNGNAVEHYDGIIIDKRLGFNDQLPLQYFNDVINEYPQQETLTVAGGSFIVSGHRDDTEAIEIEVSFPVGLWAGPNSDGISYDPWAVWIQLEYRIASTTSWNTALLPRDTTPVGSTPYWVAVAHNQASGGPNPVMVFATANSPTAHTVGEAAVSTSTFNVYDDQGTLTGTRSVTQKGTWQINPQSSAFNPATGPLPVLPGGSGPFVSTVNWYGFATMVAGNGGSTNPQASRRAAIRIDNLPPNRYDVRVTKIGSAHPWESPTRADNNSPRRGEKTVLTAVREIAHDALSYPGMAMLGLRALATSQLSGAGLNVTAEVDFGDPETIGYKHLVAADQPVLYFRFDETAGSVAADSSGRGNDGTIGTGYTLGVLGLINGSSSTAITSTAGSSGIAITTGYLDAAWAAEMWMQVPSGANGYLLWQDAVNYVKLNADGTISLTLAELGGPWTTTVAVAANTRTHFCVIVRGNSIRFFINGDPVGDFVITGANGVFGPISILKGVAGTFDEVAIYCTKLQTNGTAYFTFPALRGPRCRQRYVWGNSKHNILEGFTGDNPAMAVWNLMTNPVYGGGVSSSSGIKTGIAFSDMDEIAWRTWALRCNEIVSDAHGGTIYRHTTGYLADATSDLWTLVGKIALASGAVVMRVGTKYTVSVDMPKTPSQVFSVANIKEGTFKQTWLNLNERANSIDIAFLDQTNGFKRTVITVELDEDIAAGIPLRKAQTVELFGVTSPAEAFRYGRYKLLQAKELQQTVEFEADIDAISSSIGDVVKVQHDVPQWGASGRCASGSTTTVIQLDQAVTLVGGRSYELMVVQPFTQVEASVSGTVVSGFVQNTVLTPGSAGAMAHRILFNSGAIDREVIAIGAGWVELDDVSGITAGMDWKTYVTDVMETRAVTTGAGTTSALTVGTAFSAAPVQYQMWLFGEVNNNAQLFQILDISRTTDQVRTLKMIDYSDEIYAEAEPVVTPSPIGSTIYGPYRPTSAADDGSSGTLAWVNPSNALVADGVYATAAQTYSGSTHTGLDGDGDTTITWINDSAGVTQTTHYLKLTGFNFKVKPGEVITGIQVEINRHYEVAGGEELALAGGGVIDATVSLVKAGALVGSNRSLGNIWPTSDAYGLFGGITDTWGTTWTQTEINDPGFGVAIQATLSTLQYTNIANMAKAFVDNVYVLVSVAKVPDAGVTALRAIEVFTPDALGVVYTPQITISWRNNLLTSGVDIWIAEQPAGAAHFGRERLAVTLNGTTSYLLTPVKSNSTYRIRVVGFDMNGVRVAFATAPTATVLALGTAALPAPPPSLYVTLASTAVVDLSWDLVDATSGYELRFVPGAASASASDWFTADVLQTLAAGVTNTVVHSYDVSTLLGAYMLKTVTLGGLYASVPAIAVVDSLAMVGTFYYPTAYTDTGTTATTNPAAPYSLDPAQRAVVKATAPSYGPGVDDADCEWNGFAAGTLTAGRVLKVTAAFAHFGSITSFNLQLQYSVGGGAAITLEHATSTLTSATYTASLPTGAARNTIVVEAIASLTGAAGSYVSITVQDIHIE